MTAIKPTQAPWLLSTPALVLYATFLIAPLASVFLISFFNFEFYGGIQVSFSLNNYLEILTDSYYYEVFARTFGVALAVTLACVVLGTAEAYVLSRMRNPWKGLFLMVVLGPLLISVVVRTLGWALLFG
jgi:putative spermidine/putrescine transport system permease protein